MENQPNYGVVPKIILLVLTLIVGFVFLEFIIFKFAPQKTMYYDKINTIPVKEMYQYGEDRPVEIKPNLRILNATDLYREYEMDIITDQFGFRRETTNPLEPSVVIIGDSMTFGFTVSNGEDYPNILDASSPECQVINAGKPGAGLNHHAYHLRELLNNKESLRDIRQVIIGLNMPGNDWYEMPSLSPKIDPELTQFLTNSSQVQARKNNISNQIKAALSYSQTYTFLRQTIAPRIKHMVLEKTDTTKSEEQQYKEIGPFVEELITTMVLLAKEKNVDIVFLFLPERPHYFPKLPLYITNLQNFMKENDIQFFDLLPPMRDTYKKTSDFWQPIEGHYNASGHRFIASKIDKAGIIDCK